jgi:acetyl esterase/lipase
VSREEDIRRTPALAPNSGAAFVQPDAENMLLVNGFTQMWRDKPFDLSLLRSISNLTRPDRSGDRVSRTDDRAIEGPSGLIPVRIYWPLGAPVGVVVYFHGGGFVIGGLETTDGLCAKLTELAECVTVSVDYRLAPEHPFPAGVEDAYAAAMGNRPRPGAGGAACGGGRRRECRGNLRHDGVPDGA